jgi:hypothetical protein
MNKSELLSWLKDENRKWEALLAEVGPERMDRPGVNGDWSMKDLVAHLNGWNRWLLVRVQAAARGEPQPPPPWPANLEEDDEINAWIHESARSRPVSDVVDETRRVLEQLFAVLQALPEDVRIEELTDGETFHMVWIGDERFAAGDFFDHLHDDHEADVRAWLARTGDR